MAELHECEIARLRPTQITVGMIEVEDKRKHLDAMGHRERKDFLEARPIPAVSGPGDKLYITDHHHLARALSDGGYDSGYFLIEADLSSLALEAFWKTMQEQRWAHPIDASGQRQSTDDIPHHVDKLVDDPYRSLAGYVRERGGYAKTPTAFAEFAWADFFRPRVVIGPKRRDFDAAVEQALALAHSAAAKALPGYLAAAAR
ncbi:ParB-like protein [Dokdonella sp.]|uniref:ParB-like protein n=1 Tax=Dokdonella sp. TaxID=2291710 RepID=UPI001B1EAF25|nr:ParB-like protein [Dokdonella sp.]MBO9663329.1 chromosome partitioning protein ParB [Dokdonella sp.]